MATVRTSTRTSSEDLLETSCNRTLEVLQQGQRVLVVGGPSGSYPERWNRKKQIVIWHTNRANRTDSERPVPPGIGAIFISTKISLALQRNVLEQARTRGIWTPGVILSPGTIRRIIDPAIWCAEGGS